MNFEKCTFGVKVTENEILVETTNESLDNSRYDFLYSDRLSNSYNGNSTYSIDIEALKESEYIEFYGWKLIRLYFPGNWYGEYGTWEFEDMYGERIEKRVTRQNRYINSRQQMIKDAIAGAKKFAADNLSVEYHNIINTTSIYVRKENFVQIPDFVISVRMPLEGLQYKLNDIQVVTTRFLEGYENVMNELSERYDERSCILKDKLMKKAVDLLNKYNSFDFECLSE